MFMTDIMAKHFKTNTRSKRILISLHQQSTQIPCKKCSLLTLALHIQGLTKSLYRDLCYTAMLSGSCSFLYCSKFC